MRGLSERVVVIGANGQLGADVMHAFADAGAIGLDRATLNIERPQDIADAIARYRPALIVNTAAFHNVERCETEPERAFAVNAAAVANLAARCLAADVALLHVSTDYVFDGAASSPYAEDAPPNPLNVYGISKLAGELAVRNKLERHFIVRTSGLFGLHGTSSKGANFVERMLAQAAGGQTIRVVDETTCSPSYAAHVAQSIRALVDREAFGTYHVAGGGHCTWHAFASEIFHQAGLAPDLHAVTSDAFPSNVRRPRFSALQCAALERAGVSPPPSWPDGIAAYLAERAALLPR